MTYADRIVAIATQYIGFQETPNNSGFRDKEFEARMRDVGWEKGQAWCAYFAELVWKEAYTDNREVWQRLDKLFSGSSTATYKNFELNKLFTCSQTPVPGAVAIYRFGVGWQGHTGIVKSVDGQYVLNIEGNTNSQGGREGFEVALKRRPVKTKFSQRGLNLVGYIHPMEVI